MVEFLGANANEKINGTSGRDVLNGNGGNDVLFGGAGDDLIIGGPGFDTARYGSDFEGYTFTSLQPKEVIIEYAPNGVPAGRDGEDRFRSDVEKIEFKNGAFLSILEAPEPID